MRIAFVGMRRKYLEIDPEYRDAFNQYHLEIPYHYSQAGNRVTITTIDDHWSEKDVGLTGGLRCQPEKWFVESDFEYDIVVHWRKWFPELYKPEAVNLMICQDHSYDDEWKRTVRAAVDDDKLRGILCYTEWHKKNTMAETGLDESLFLVGFTAGVDTEVYRPAETKEPHEMLWASDPGRGLLPALELADRLYRADNRFRLNVCWPDYVKGDYPINHPAVRIFRNMSNGSGLWNLFGTCGILPYTSTFKEPFSRACRQAQSAGCLVLYPPGMGSPSGFIESGKTGIVAPVEEWPHIISHLVTNGNWKKIGEQARVQAVREDWSVLAKNFNVRANELLKDGPGW